MQNQSNLYEPQVSPAAISAIQRVLSSDSVHVTLLGDDVPWERSSLLFVAGAAMEKGLQGFGFDGIPGKFVVPLSMAEVAALHKVAVREVAEESARTALGVWTQGGKVSDISDWGA